MHDPVSLDASGCLSGVEDQGFLDPKRLLAACRLDWLVGPGGLPVPSPGSSVGPRPVRVFPVPRCEEVPLSLSEQRLLC